MLKGSTIGSNRSDRYACVRFAGCVIKCIGVM